MKSDISNLEYSKMKVFFILKDVVFKCNIRLTIVKLIRNKRDSLKYKRKG